MKKIIAWIVLSSKDPNKVSLMIKGLALGAVTWIVFFAGLFNVNLQPTDVALLIEEGAKLLEWALTGISIIMTVYGMIRKIVTTAKGENEVLNQY